MLTIEQVSAQVGAQHAAQVGAQINRGLGGCQLSPPSWYTTAADNRTGECRPGQMRQCNAVWGATVDVGMGGSGTLTFDVSASNFQKFKPAYLKFLAVAPGAAENDHTRGITATALTHAGRNYLGTATTALNLWAYGIFAQRALSAIDLPTLVPGGQDVTLTVQNIDTATDLTLYGVMVGWAVRG